MTENHLASHLSRASFVHEVMEYVVVFDGQDIHHVFKLKMVVIKYQQIAQLLPIVIKNFG